MKAENQAKQKGVFRANAPKGTKAGDVFKVPKPCQFTIGILGMNDVTPDIIEEYSWYIRLPKGDIEIANPSSNFIRKALPVGEYFTLPNNFKPQTFWERLRRKPKELKQFMVTKSYLTTAEYEEV